MNWRVILSALLISVCTVLTGQGIQNGSLEQARQNPGNSFIRLEIGDPTLVNWKVESGSVDYIGTYWKAADGQKSLDMNGALPGAVSTVIGTTAGEKVFLQFAFAGNPNCEDTPVKKLQVRASGFSQEYSFDVSGRSSESMGWEDVIFEFVADAAQTTVYFSSLNDGHCGPAIDNLRLVEVDCAGTVNGTAVTDACGECLEPEDPRFNQSCTDCAGTVNGTAVVDDCGVCLEPNDAAFNQSCTDCAGTPNGSSVVDDCGECLPVNDPTFNQSCTDCAGTPNGTAVVDDCGECLEPTDSTFNQSCTDCAGVTNGIAAIDGCGNCLEPDDPDFSESCEDHIYIPTSFSPNGDEVNDVFAVFKDADVEARIRSYSVFSRWGELVYQMEGFAFTEAGKWWNGSFRGQKVKAGTYVYLIEVEFTGGQTRLYRGEVQVVNPQN